jgi:hypothetical protein
VIVHYLNVSRTNISPNKADSPLIIDANAVLTFTVALQGFKTIAWWCAQKRQRLGGVQLRKLAFGDSGERPEPARALAIVQRQSVFALERLDHGAVYYAWRNTTSPVLDRVVLDRRLGMRGGGS